jgi:hypothetical protein
LLHNRIEVVVRELLVKIPSRRVIGWLDDESVLMDQSRVKTASRWSGFVATSLGSVWALDVGAIDIGAIRNVWALRLVLRAGVLGTIRNFRTSRVVLRASILWAIGANLLRNFGTFKIWAVWARVLRWLSLRSLRDIWSSVLRLVGTHDIGSFKIRSAWAVWTSILIWIRASNVWTVWSLVLESSWSIFAIRCVLRAVVLNTFWALILRTSLTHVVIAGRSILSHVLRALVLWALIRLRLIARRSGVFLAFLSLV